MEFIQVTKDNLEKEHICCAISNNKDVQVSSKKAWLAERFDEGLVFLKSAERGKCFIEYIPAENAWVPIVADNYMYIDCLWVSGAFKGHGYSTELLDACISDSKEVDCSHLKRPILATCPFRIGIREFGGTEEICICSGIISRYHHCTCCWEGSIRDSCCRFAVRFLRQSEEANLLLFVTANGNDVLVEFHVVAARCQHQSGGCNEK